MLHHFAKLSENSLQRAPGERMVSGWASAHSQSPERLLAAAWQFGVEVAVVRHCA